MPNEDLTFRPMHTSAEDFQLFKECFAGNGMQKDSAHLHWQYFSNPSQRPLVNFALASNKSGSKIASIYATIPVRVGIGGCKRLAAQSLDTLTHINYRRRGLFKTLAEAVYQRCVHEDVHFVYGFPNANSSHGFFERLGWTPLHRVPFLFRPKCDHSVRMRRRL